MSGLKAVVVDCFGVLYPDYTLTIYERYKDRFGGDPGVMDRLNQQIDLGQIDRSGFFQALEGWVGVSAQTLQNDADRELVVDRDLVRSSPG